MRFKVFLLLLSCSFLCYGIEPPAKKGGTGQGLNFSVTQEFMPLKHVNVFLDAHNYSIISENELKYLALGWSARKSPESPFTGRLSVYSSIPLSQAGKSHFHAYGISADFTYDLLKKIRWCIAPAVGYYFNYSSLVLKSQTIESGLSKGMAEEYFGRGNFGMKAGINIQYEFDISGHTFGIGITPYYKLNFGGKNWYNTNGNNLEGIPVFGNSCFQIQVLVDFFL